MLKLQYCGTWCEELTHWKRPWERLRAGGDGGNRGWDGWMASLTQQAWIWANSGGDSDGQGRLTYCSPWGCKESDMTEHWTYVGKTTTPGKECGLDPSGQGCEVVLAGVPGLLLNLWKGEKKSCGSETFQGEEGNSLSCVSCRLQGQLHEGWTWRGSVEAGMEQKQYLEGEVDRTWPWKRDMGWGRKEGKDKDSPQVSGLGKRGDVHGGRKVGMFSHWLHWRYSVVAPFLTYSEVFPSTPQPGPIALAIALSPPCPLWAVFIPMARLGVPSSILSENPFCLPDHSQSPPAPPTRLLAQPLLMILIVPPHSFST